MNFKLQLRKAYDKDALRRDVEEKVRDGWKLVVRQDFVDVLKREGKKTILELGSGAGLDAKYFQDMGFDALATDLSSEMVKKCLMRGVRAKKVDLYNLKSLKKIF